MGRGNKVSTHMAFGEFQLLFEGILHNFYQLRVAEVKQTANSQEGEVDDQATRMVFN